MYNERSDDYQPLFWWMGRPIYVNTLIVIGHVVGLVVTELMLAAGLYIAVSYFSLNTYAVVHNYQAWRLFSYIVFTPTDAWGAVNFIFAMGFLFYFGRQVEEYIGRKAYSVFFAALVLVPALILCLAGPLGFGWPMNELGGFTSIFGVMIAFATLYPGAEISIWFVNLSAKAWAFALLGLISLVYIATHSWPNLVALWIDSGIGYLGMRYLGAGYGMTWLTDWIEERRATRLAKKNNIRVLEDRKDEESIDSILEKISKQGVASLDARERAALERARANLLKRDSR